MIYPLLHHRFQTALQTRNPESRLSKLRTLRDQFKNYHMSISLVIKNENSARAQEKPRAPSPITVHIPTPSAQPAVTKNKNTRKGGMMSCCTLMLSCCSVSKRNLTNKDYPPKSSS